MESYTIREVTAPRELQVIEQLAREIWTEHYTPIIGEAQVSYMLDRFQTAERMLADIRDRNYHYLLLESAGRSAGYAAWQPDPQLSAAFLSKLYVHANFRGQGLGRLLLDHICQQSGARKIWLTVNKNNVNSISAYQKMGFAIADTCMTDIGSGYVMDDYVMELETGDD
jgi:ribosomal protein S18 acetylase RimI-like enzyme